MSQAPSRLRRGEFSSDVDWAAFRVPDVAGVFGNGAVAGKAAGGGDVQDGFAGPGFLVCIEFTKTRMSIAVALEVGQMEIMITMVQEGIEDWSEHARLVVTEVVAGNEIERGAGF